MVGLSVSRCVSWLVLGIDKVVVGIGVRLLLKWVMLVCGMWCELVFVECIIKLIVFLWIVLEGFLLCIVLLLL